MRFSLGTFPYDRWGGLGPLTKAVELADELGFYSVALPDHVVMPSAGEQSPLARVWYDPFVLATHLAACTERIRILFHVLVAPFHPPIQTAKAIATLDHVSNGRITLGVGEGWMKGEFAALGVDRAQRAAITDETIEAMKALWTERDPEFEGEHIRFSDITFEPRCLQEPHVPIWVGGAGVRAIRRAVEMGDGWAPMQQSPQSLAGQVARVRQGLHDAGRSAAGFTVSIPVQLGHPDAPPASATGATERAEDLPPPPSTPADILATLRAYGDADVDHVVLNFPWRDPDDYKGWMRWFAAEVMPEFAVRPSSPPPPA